MLTELKRYKEHFGHCNVPDRCRDNPKLGNWVRQQRRLQRRGALSPVRKAQLHELGLVFDPQNLSWEKMFTELQRYKEQFGHCNAPEGSAEDPQLGRWAKHQRELKRAGQLYATRKVRLDELGFAWAPHDSFWETMFAELRRYKEQFGHCNVPWEKKNRTPLAQWVSSQRSKCKRGRLSADRETRLEAIGFIWDDVEHSWEVGYVALKRYKEEFGHCNVTRQENSQLGNWVYVLLGA